MLLLLCRANAAGRGLQDSSPVNSELQVLGTCHQEHHVAVPQLYLIHQAHLATEGLPS